MASTSKRRFQFSIQTILIATLAFALGFAARNMISGLEPWAVRATLPSSAGPIAPGDWIYIESDMHPEYGRRVRVLSDGTITLKGVGTINVSGQNITQMQDTVRNEYKKHFADSTYRSFELFRADVSEPLN
jgi:protein involved in polysaccharide export with SLBB domain